MTGDGAGLFFSALLKTFYHYAQESPSNRTQRDSGTPGMGFSSFSGRFEYILVQKTAIFGQKQPNMLFRACWMPKREMREMLMFLAENGGFGFLLDVPRGPRLIRPQSGDIISRCMPNLADFAQNDRFCDFNGI